jgi:diguanylate cyclase (GGDEF)-like protein
LVCTLGLDAQKTLTMMEAFRLQNEKKPMTTVAGELIVTFSCGISEFGEEQIDRVLLRADEALYKAKDAGRNQIVVS